MRNVIILGSGRSGTSMVAGTLQNAGYFMGASLYGASKSNPKGFFEDREINDINEEILKLVIPSRPPLLGRWFYRNRPNQRGQYWLAQLPLTELPPVEPEIHNRIRQATKKSPFCFKDPRFSYTLPVWRSFTNDTVYVCIFRHPSDTVKSILKMCARERYLSSLDIDRIDGFEIWYCMYKHILDRHRLEGEWLFLHYEQMLSEEGLTRLEEHTRAKVDRSFPDPSLRRSEAVFSAPVKASELYSRLCTLAEYSV